MTLYKFPSGKIVSDEDYKKTFSEEYPSDRPEAQPDYVLSSSDKSKQIVFNDDDEEEEE